MTWTDLARRQSGVVARSQLLASGLSEDQVRGLVRRQELVRLHAAIYAHGSVHIGVRQRHWVATLWSGGVVSHRSAAPLWSIEVQQTRYPAEAVHITADGRRLRCAPPYVEVHRVALGPSDRTTIRGLPVTTRRRTLIDLLRTEAMAEAHTILDRAVQLGWLRAEDLRREVDHFPGRPGNGCLTELLGQLDPGAQAESERIFHRLLSRAGIDGWQPQLRVRAGSRVYHLDVGFRDELVGVEIDGRRHHDIGSGRFESDRVRQNALVTAGWLILRFTWQRLTQQPEAVIAELNAALAHRGRAIS